MLPGTKRATTRTANMIPCPPYNHPFAVIGIALAMEAEHINQIASTLADLMNRTAELRRYL